MPIFAALTDAPKLVDESTKILSELETYTGNIQDAIDSLMNIDTSLPTFTSTTAKGVISITPPTITIPSLPSFTYSLSPTGIPIEVTIDICHFESAFGSIMQMLMKAISTVVDAAIDAAVKILSDIVELFMVLVGPQSVIWTWIKEAGSALWTQLKTMYNTVLNNKKDCEKQAENATSKEEKDTALVKSSLWSNVVAWFSPFLKKIGAAWDAIIISFWELVEAIEDAGKFFMEKLSALGTELADIAKDLSCLTKKCTQGFK